MKECIMYTIVLIHLFVLAIMDVRYKYVNIHIVLTGCMAAIMVRLLYNQSLADALIGMLIGGVIIIAARLTDQAIGYGDGLVMVFLGISLGFQAALTVLFISLMLISVCGLILIALGLVNKNNRWPMIPWLFVSYVIGVAVW